jgi:hypothetical protein
MFLLACTSASMTVVVYADRAILLKEKGANAVPGIALENIGATAATLRGSFGQNSCAFGNSGVYNA